MEVSRGLAFVDIRGDKLDDFRKRGIFTDICFVVDGARFNAHKVILCCQSEVFEAMFKTSTQEAISGEVRIADVSTWEFECFLQYLYTGALPSVSIDRLAELIHCSEKYGVTELTRTIERKMYDHCVINTQSFLEFLPIADMYNLELFKEAAITTITRNGRSVGLSGWYTLASSHFPLAKEAINAFVPNNLTETWNFTPDLWTWDGLQNPSTAFEVTLRNNGKALNLSTRFSCKRRTLYCVLSLNRGCDSFFDVQIKFDFSVRTNDGELIHSGRGNVWWEVGDGQVNPEALFECVFKNSPAAVEHSLFSVDMTFTQWVSRSNSSNPYVTEGGLSRVYSTPRGSVPVNVPVYVAGEEFIVDKTQFSRESSFFSTFFAQDQHCYTIDGINKTTFSTIHSYVTTGFLPQKKQVDLSLLAAAKKFNLKELTVYCESSLIGTLNHENVIDSLIVASEENCRDLETKALRFIDFHHRRVISSDSWSRLEYHPYLVVAIVKTMLFST